VTALRPYAAVVSARFRALLQYRAAALAGVVTQLVWGLLRAQVFTAFYDAAPGPQPLSRAQVITYVWLGQALFALLPVQLDADVRELVRRGDVAHELLRPVDLYGLWYARALATRTAPTLLRAVPLLVVARLFLGLAPPASGAALAGWLLTLTGALLVGCAFMTLCTVLLVYTVSPDGVARWAPQLTYVLSGMVVPLPLLPGPARAVLERLPFRGMVDVPSRIYAGDPTLDPLLQFAQQLAWTAALVLVGRWLLARGLRRLEVQGG
jgi:ABC-2 type transport system permease protein